MKKYLQWGLPIFILATLSYFVWGFTTKLNRKKEVAQRVQTLPNFTASLLDRSVISKTTLAGQPVVLLYFDPDCDHCQREADELYKKSVLLKQAMIVMLSSAPISDLTTFTEAYKLNALPNVRVAHIDRQVAYDTLGFTSVPDVLIYHADGSLAKHFKGETSVEAIARHL
ncbi:TlpA family protein disulfide reductase [Spirosoma soli]|uniref:TlpA family protein disulfide reductase n=1 Tax=Spirosoma soli TaxID=1770529 RepID=A0ABW5M103_9BACT